jgi:hypothetical protein
MSAEQTVTNGKATIAEQLDDTSGVDARLLRSRLIALNRRPGLSCSKASGAFEIKST